MFDELYYEPTKWDLRFMKIAKFVSKWSKDPSTKVGVVATTPDRRIIATGYNGFPIGIEDSEEMYADRETKYKYIIHAEQNCIYNAGKAGVSLEYCSMYVWGLPVCNECAKAIIQTGIQRVVIDKTQLNCNDKWIESFRRSIELLQEAGIIIDILDA